MAESSYKIDQTSAERIDAVVRKVLGTGDRTATGNLPPRDQAETVWAKLTSKIDQGDTKPDLWQWSEVYRKEDGTWESVTNGRRGDNTAADPNKLLAIELEKQAGSANAIVLLRRVQTKQPDDTWRTGWGIVKPKVLPPPRQKFMVLQIMDDGGTIDWDWTKGH